MAGFLIRSARDRNVIMLFAVAAGLAWGGAAPWTEKVALPALAAIMTVATVNVRWHVLASPGAALKPAFIGIIMTFALQAFAMAGVARLLVANEAFRSGFYLLAAVPPAVAVIPFTLFVKGDTAFSLAGTIGAYLGAMVISPALMVLFLGAGFLDPLRLLTLFLELIVAPVILARILKGTGISSRIEPYYGAITNWGFFLVVYTMVGLNRPTFLLSPLSILPVCLVAVITTFPLGWAVRRAGRLLGASPPVRASMVLLATFKNYGLAGGIALVFFTPETMVPATVSSVIAIFYIVRLEARARRA